MGTNCWELLKCGKESNCPAYPDHGRECYAVTGTMCNGKQQGAENHAEPVDQVRVPAELHQEPVQVGVSHTR